MNLENLPTGSDPPNEVNAVIEVPVGGEPIKYETDKAAGMLVVDRFLYTPMRYPGNYGFIPHTLSEDGDPCDVLVANTRPLMPGCAISVRPVGVLRMVDEGGGDEKIVAVPVSRLTQRTPMCTTTPICPRSCGGRSSTSLRTTRTSNRANGRKSPDGGRGGRQGHDRTSHRPCIESRARQEATAMSLLLAARRGRFINPS